MVARYFLLISAFLLFNPHVFLNVNGAVTDADENAREIPPLLVGVGKFEGKVYFSDNQTYDWYESRQFCRKNHLIVASIDSLNEFEYLHKQLNEGFGGKMAFWVNADDDRSFKWLNSKTPVTIATEYDTPADENCLILKPYGNKKLYVGSCMTKYGNVQPLCQNSVM